MSTKVTSVDDYIAGFPSDVQITLQRLRETLAASIPVSAETIRYGMPAVMSNGRYVVHYAGWKQHIGLYPIPPLQPTLEAEIAPYRSTKDTMRLPLRSPLPYELIGRLATALATMRAADEG